jgi:hypothetical protein
MSFISKWKDKIAHDIGDKIDAVKLNFIEKTSAILGYLLFSFIALFILLGILIFAGLGLSEVFAELFDSRSGGYFATMGVYLLMIATLFAFRKNVGDAFAGIFIKMLTQQQDDDKDDDEEEKEN